MFDADQVRKDYDRLAREYADHLCHELDGKPFDRELLRRFVAELPSGARVCDLGCGPGHVAQFLKHAGADVFGLDLSRRMVDEARQRFPDLTFEVGDLFVLPMADESLGAMVAFYSIVNLPPESLPQAFAEMRRVLKTDGKLLLSFHVGEERVRPGNLWGQEISMEFFFHQPAAIRSALESADFEVMEVHERPPYGNDVEYPSQRAYIVAQAV